MSLPQSRFRANLESPSGSATITQTASQAQPDRVRVPASGTLRLRAQAPSNTQVEPEPERRVQWAEDVVNNEGMGKKSSKVCCIYHKPRAVGESSDEDSSSDSSSDDDSDNDDGGARPSRKNHAKHAHGKGHKHEHGESCGHGGNDGVKSKNSSKRAANAYERIPKNT